MIALDFRFDSEKAVGGFFMWRLNLQRTAISRSGSLTKKTTPRGSQSARSLVRSIAHKIYHVRKDVLLAGAASGP